MTRPRNDSRDGAPHQRRSARPVGKPTAGAGGKPPAASTAGRPGSTAGRSAGPRVDPARRAAYETLEAVHRDGAYANLFLPRTLRETRLGGRDAAFATELAYGCLRLTGTLDAVISTAAGREMERIDPPARDALRLGAYQLLRMRVPSHAAVATSVDLVRVLVPGAAGFVNAVLRRIAERTWDGWVDELAPADPAGRLAVAHAHPPWVVRAFSDALDGDLDETAALLAADNEAAPVHLCARPGRLDAAALADAVGGRLARWSPYGVYLPGGAPGDLVEVNRGLAHVQDEGSQLVASALVDAALAGPDRAWLDLCAGPGGKSGLLGALAAGRGAELTAVEIAPHRADLVARATQGLPVEVLCADGREMTGEYDRVLVDAPCTGLGSLRRRPEARWRRQPSDLPPLTRLQRELLGAALRVVRPGGVVAYVTCSPHLVETQVTVTETARRSPFEVELLDARAALPAGLPGLGSGPTVQLWPHRHGTDAMYLALLRRTG